MAGFNLFQRFYYGKAGQADYTPDQLPDNRVQLFFEMLRTHFARLFTVNLIYLLFCLPALIWSAINFMVLQTGDLQDPQGLLLFAYLPGMIPCLGLAGVGATGEMRILRNLARDQHVFLMSDYKDAIRGNWKQGLLVGLINGFSLFIAAMCFFFYGQLARESALWMLPQMLALTVTAVWWMMNMLMFPMMVTYDLKFKDLVRNAAIMVVARLPWSILFLAGSVGVPALIALFVPYGEIAMILLYLALGFSLTGLIYASYANSCFDRFLNPRIEGAQVGMGLRDRTEDDLSDENIDEDEPDTLV